MKKWLCVICGWIYDEAKGWPNDGIAPGTKWEDIPDDWACPECGVGKEDFEMIEVTTPVATEAVSQADIDTTEPPVVIIGTGYAGYTLAETLRGKNPELNIVMFTTDDGANYSKPALSTAFAKEQSADDLIKETVIEIEKRLNIRIYARCKIQNIDTSEQILHSDFGALKYSKLIMATGAEPIRLPLEGSGAADVLSVNDLEDYRHFRATLGENKRVAIIGNGLIGCEFANDLSATGHKVSVIGLTRWAMDPLLPQEIGEGLQKNLSAQDVDWYLERTVTSVEKSANGYSLTLSDGSLIECDLVLSAVGLKPRTALAEKAGINCNRGISVNGGLRTNVPNIFAIGDCCEIQGQFLPYIAPITFGVRALADCLLGRPTMAQYPVMPVLVKTPALPLTIVPPKAGTEGNWEVEATENGYRGLYRDTSGQLDGFALAGDATSERQALVEQLLP